MKVFDDFATGFKINRRDFCIWEIPRTDFYVMPKISTNPENPNQDFPYAGAVTVAGHQLIRKSDGVTWLAAIDRGEQFKHNRMGRYYVVDKTQPGQPYVSSLYGREFEHDGIRYRIDYTTTTDAEIVPLRRVKKRGRGR